MHGFTKFYFRDSTSPLIMDLELECGGQNSLLCSILEFSCFDDAYSVHCKRSELFGFGEMAFGKKAAGLVLLEYNYFITEKKVIVNVGRHG
jgi:hypothetical protein